MRHTHTGTHTHNTRARAPTEIDIFYASPFVVPFDLCTKGADRRSSCSAHDDVQYIQTHAYKHSASSELAFFPRFSDGFGLFSAALPPPCPLASLYSFSGVRRGCHSVCKQQHTQNQQHNEQWQARIMRLLCVCVFRRPFETDFLRLLACVCARVRARLSRGSCRCHCCSATVQQIQN